MKKKTQIKVEEKIHFSIKKTSDIPPLPDITDKTKLDVRYPLIEPYAYVHIYWDANNSELIYELEEPKLNEREKTILAVLEEGVRELINITFINVKDTKDVIAYLEKNLKVLLTELDIKVNEESFLKMIYYIYRNFVGLNQIEPLMRDYYIEDIECNGVDTPLYIVHRKYRNLRTTVEFKDVKRLSGFVEKLAQKCGKYVSYASPLLDGALPDGSIEFNEPLIYKENGIVKISKIGGFVDKFYKDGSCDPIKVDNIEVSAFGKDLKIKWKKADYVYRHKNNEDLYKLNLEFGRSVVLTKNHSVFSLTKKGVNAVKTSELKVGDYVVVPLEIPENNVIKEINLAEELSKTDYKFLLNNVPIEIFTENENAIKDYIKENYKRFHQTFYEFKKKRILPIRLYSLLDKTILSKCEIGTTSAVKIPTILHVDKNLVRLLGHFIAEGWQSSISSRHEIILCFHKNELDHINEVKNYMKKCFNVDMRLNKNSDNAVKLNFNSYVLWVVFNEVLKIKEYAKNKEVPELILNVNKDLQKEFLDAWHNSDFGSTASVKLASDVSYLSLFNKDVAAFYNRERESIIEGRKVLSNEYYTNFFRRDVSNDYSSMIPMELFNPLKDVHHRLGNKRVSRDRLRKILDETRFKRFHDLTNIDSKKFLREWIERGFLTKNGFTNKGKELLSELKIVDNLIDSNLGFFKINSIDRTTSKSKYVYDLSVKGDENFVGGFGGICCHNSRVNATYTGDISSRGPTFCIADGYFQLSNGVFKEIDILFNECKEKFGSKLEKGNEIVEVINLNCCGVDEDNLKQIDSKVKTVIKLAPPKELVEVELEDGSNITVTTNHKFHIVNNKLNQMEAKDLKKGMFMPIPTKVNVSGYQQKINTYSLIKDFSYIKKVCIVSNAAIKSLVNTEISSFKDQNGFYRQQRSNQFGVHNSYFYEVISRGTSISFEVLDKMCNGTNFKSLGDISLVVYGGGTKDKSKAIKIPSTLDEDLAYLTGILISDGHLSKDYLDISCFDSDIKEKVKILLKQKFGFYNSYYNDTRIYLCNIFAPYFFNKIFNIPIGHKTFNVKIPKIISKSDNKTIASFIKGLFDGDGTCKSGLSYKSYSKELVYGLTYLLARLGIYSYVREIKFDKKTEYKLNIPSIYYKKYLDLIGFESKEKLNYLINRQVDHKTNIRHGRIPSKIILDLMKKLNLSKSEVSEKCNVNYNRFYYDSFSRSFVNKFLNLIENEKEVKEEVKFIKWMLESNQEFVKIKKVNVFDNKDKKPVYDIELEPCKYFIAGNKPMNIFDTIRKFTVEPWSPVQLMQFRTVSPEILAFLWLLIEHESNIMVIGGTGSGKTSFLNALAFFIPPQARVVSIEDSVTGDSKIIIKQKQETRNITIKEFVDKKIDAEVMTLDEDGKIIFTKPSKYIKHKVKKDIYEVITSTGRRVKVTQDHSLFTLGDDGLKEAKPLDLEENKSFIATPRNLPIKGENVEEINLINNLSKFKEDFIQGEPVKKIFEEYSFKDLNISKSSYAWWKRNNIIKISKFMELKINFSYEELKEIKIKSKNTSSIPIIFKITQEFLEFCGLWIGDGSYDRHNKNSVIVSNSDYECRNLIKKVADYLGSNYSRMNDGGVSIRIHSTVFYKFMKYVLKFKGRSKTKEIPEFIFGLSNKQIKHFIRGYYSADGCVRKYEVGCTSQSYGLLEGLQTILLRFGIISRINKHVRKDKCIDMNVSSNENLNKFKEIGFLQERKNIKLNLLNKKATHACSDVIPLTKLKINKLNNLINNKVPSGYLRGVSNIGRDHLQRIAPTGSEFNDISHNDILWDKVIKIRKVSSKEVEVFDLSIPGYEKFLCNNIFVHNTKELHLLHENWLPSVARAGVGLANITGAKHGEVSLFDLLKESFRQRPDYVIVGEIRGKEAFVLFQGMASGHPSFGTMHAENVETMIRRLETPPISLPASLVASMDAVCTMVQVKVEGKSVRRLRDVVEIVNVTEQGVSSNKPFVWDPRSDGFFFKTDSKIFNKIVMRHGLTPEKLQLEFRRRTELLMKLYKNNISGYKEVHDIINIYYKTPERVLSKFGIQ